jgi:hypothetical protein
MHWSRGSATARPQPHAWVAVGLVCCLAATGCARLRAFGKGDPTPFGTDLVKATDLAPGVGAASGDIYANRASGSSGSVGRSDESRRDDPAELPELTDAKEPRPANTDHPRVDLEPPVPTHRQRELASSARPTKPRQDDQGDRLASVLADSRNALEAVTTYQVRMNHQERVGGILKPSEDVLLSIRRHPKAVRLEWTEGSHKGREVLYAENSGGGQMHVRMGDTVLMPRLSMAPDSPMAMSNSRHPITEAGFDTILDNMEKALTKQQAGDFSLGKIRFDGRETPEPIGRPCDRIVRVTPEQETWVVHLDAGSHLPVMVQATAGNGDLLERYTFGAPTTEVPALAAADAFDPDARWGQPKGLLGRLGRSDRDESQTR